MKKTLLSIAILFVVLISGCATDDFEEIVGECPVVLSTNPDNGAIGVPLNQIITVTFNEEMDLETIDESSIIITTTGDGTVPGTVTYSGTTATFTSTNALTANTIYNGRVKTLAKDTNGNALQTDFIWTFTTGTAPIVQSTDPDNNQTGVPLNKIITATFNMPMNPLTLNETTFTIKLGADTILGEILYTGSTVSFRPYAQLESNRTYTGTITTGARNLAGTPLAANYVWNFTTVASAPVIGNPPPTSTSNLFFGVFGGNAGITNQGLFTVVNGNIGTTAASTLMTGFREVLTGDAYTVTFLNEGRVMAEIFADAPAPGNATKAATALAGLNAAQDAYLSISPASMPGGIDPGAGELGGLTLAPGIYKSDSGTFDITNGDLTLDAKGDPNAIFVFQTASALTVGDSSPSSVKLINGALAKNVYWYVGSAAVINYAGGGVMTGNIIANSGVTLSSPANSTNASVTTLNGRAISLVSSVTMVNAVINVPD
ncbi:ice-binding family protein [Flavobacterium piscis]|uniref:SbsA Ig-like domain-containing protein n=1 Tax=Flavobacterium piscis TaxID=1114874 RepID=A0ABU1Y5I3_9FLAO|nr:ice-binding family protein [Flavobacterium piscis]MDR7209487.1 hypothetical protein [Flavobacterium piscis]